MKLTKKQFEKKLFKLNKNEVLSYRKHNEHNYEDGSNSIIHLYYNDNGHIGTWQKGGHSKIFHERLPYSNGDAIWHTLGYSDEMMLSKMHEWEAMTGKKHPNRIKILLANDKLPRGGLSTKEFREAADYHGLLKGEK
jgi:hypothetical protein